MMLLCLPPIETVCAVPDESGKTSLERCTVAFRCFEMTKLGYLVFRDKLETYAMLERLKK